MTNNFGIGMIIRVILLAAVIVGGTYATKCWDSDQSRVLARDSTRVPAVVLAPVVSEHRLATSMVACCAPEVLAPSGNSELLARLDEELKRVETLRRWAPRSPAERKRYEELETVSLQGARVLRAALNLMPLIHEWQAATSEYRLALARVKCNTGQEQPERHETGTKTLERELPLPDREQGARQQEVLAGW